MAGARNSSRDVATAAAGIPHALDSRYSRVVLCGTGALFRPATPSVAAGGARQLRVHCGDMVENECIRRQSPRSAFVATSSSGIAGMGLGARDQTQRAGRMTQRISWRGVGDGSEEQHGSACGGVVGRFREQGRGLQAAGEKGEEPGRSDTLTGQR